MNRISSITAKRVDDFIKSNNLYCETVNCKNELCRHYIDKIYDLLIDSIKDASIDFVKTKVRKDKFNVIPGWNRNVKCEYKKFREKYLNWLLSGKPRDGNLFDEMKIARSQFKRALDFTIKNRNNEVLISIQNNFINKDMNKFWSEVRSRKGGKSCTAIIDGYSESKDIVQVFTNKFLSKNNFINNLESSLNLVNGNNSFNICTSSHRVKEFIKNLNPGSGHDNIHSRLLENASCDFIEVITYFFNLCFRHCFIPHILLKGEITPIIKDKKGNKCDSDNYRPIMQSSCLLKLIEMHLLNILEDKLFFDSKQFGFCDNTSTSDACFLLKETIHSYISKKSQIFAGFIDLSKAFDLVNYKLLLEILRKKGIPHDITELIKFYLQNQFACVKWNGLKGDPQIVNRGVRQGGILSPILFKVYLDDIIKRITNLGVGCRLGLSAVNIIAYADDIVLLAKSRECLDVLYREFLININKLDLKINTNKSKVVIFSKGKLKNNISHICLNDTRFEVVSQFKYLGNILTHNLEDEADVLYKLNSFYSAFNSCIRSFKGVNLETLIHLFKSFCLPQYGLALWTSHSLYCKQSFKSFEVAYNNAIKNIVECPRYASSHIAAEICQLLMLKHLI